MRTLHRAFFLVLALIWLYVENQPQEKLANHAWYTFWYVLPTLPMFLAFPVLLPRWGFWLAHPGEPAQPVNG